MERALLRGRRGRNNHLPGEPAKKLRPIAQGEPYEIDGNENWLAMQLNGPRFLILAVDQSNRLYGFTEQAIGENLPQMHVSVTFYPKEKGKRFPEGQVDHVQRLLYGTRAGTGS